MLFIFFMKMSLSIISLRLGQNGCYFKSDILKFIFLTKYKNLLKFVTKGSIDNKSALV